MDVRAFIAIELDRPMQDELARFERRLQDDPAGRFVRWVVPQNIHLTLKFLGNIQSEVVPRLADVLTDAVRQFTPFELQTQNVGAFPNLHRPNNIWVGLAGDTRQTALLTRAVEDACAGLGLPRDDRGFTPHLTLGRLKREVSSGERTAVGKLIQAHSINSLVVRVDHIALISSDLRSGGPIYSRLALLRFGQDVISRPT